MKPILAATAALLLLGVANATLAQDVAAPAAVAPQAEPLYVKAGVRCPGFIIVRPSSDGDGHPWSTFERLAQDPLTGVTRDIFVVGDATKATAISPAQRGLMRALLQRGIRGVQSLPKLPTAGGQLNAWPFKAKVDLLTGNRRMEISGHVVHEVDEQGQPTAHVVIARIVPVPKAAD